MGFKHIIVVTLLALIFAICLILILPFCYLNKCSPQGLGNPYSPTQLRGRQVYLSEGCVTCHSQQPRSPTEAPDYLRGWGMKPNPSDYLYDFPPLLGTMRTGPDLFNVGYRQRSVIWHLVHLFQPRSVVEWSVMPSYSYLFVIKSQAVNGEVVVPVSKKWHPEGSIVIASQKALDLVHYLIGMDHVSQK